MGVFAGPITFRRFRVIGELPPSFRDIYLESIARHVHREIDPASEEERTYGWVCAGDLLDTEFDLNKVLVGDYLLLQLRVDTLKIPPTALKLYLMRAEREYQAATGRERLSKADKEEVKDRVVKALRKRVLPGVKGFDVAWNIQTGIVRLWTHEKTVGDAFQDLFAETFDLRLVPRTPYTCIDELSFDEGAADGLLELDPADLVGVTHGARTTE